jgi:hypothetical protein
MEAVVISISARAFPLDVTSQAAATTATVPISFARIPSLPFLFVIPNLSPKLNVNGATEWKGLQRVCAAAEICDKLRGAVARTSHPSRAGE